jgi:hypothetical protein
MVCVETKINSAVLSQVPLSPTQAEQTPQYGTLPASFQWGIWRRVYKKAVFQEYNSQGNEGLPCNITTV